MNQTHIEQTLTNLLPAELVTQQTRLHIASLISRMVNAKSEEAGWRIRYELQGVFSCLALQGAISELQLETLGDEVGNAWKPFAQSFVVQRVG